MAPAASLIMTERKGKAMTRLEKRLIEVWKASRGGFLPIPTDLTGVEDYCAMHNNGWIFGKGDSYFVTLFGQNWARNMMALERERTAALDKVYRTLPSANY